MRFDDYFGDPSALGNLGNFDVRRTVHFVRTLRDSMLANGQALGDRHIRRRYARRADGSEVVVVQVDDSWDERTRQHTQHGDDDNPDDGSWDGGDLIEYEGEWIGDYPDLIWEGEPWEGEPP